MKSSFWSLFLLCVLALFFKPYYGRQRLLKRKYHPRYNKHYKLKHELKRELNRLQREEQELARLQREEQELAQFNARFMYNEYYNGYYDDNYDDDEYHDDEYYELEYDEFFPGKNDEVKLGALTGVSKGFSHKTGVIKHVIGGSPKPYLIAIDGTLARVALAETDFVVLRKAYNDIFSFKKKNKNKKSDIGWKQWNDDTNDIQEIGDWEVGDEIVITDKTLGSSFQKTGKIIADFGMDAKWPVKMDQSGQTIKVFSSQMQPKPKFVADYTKTKNKDCSGKTYNNVKLAGFTVPRSEPLFGEKHINLFHATDKKSAVSIMKSKTMYPGAKGWVDGGIYFAASPLEARAKAYAAWLYHFTDQGDEQKLKDQKYIQMALKKAEFIIEAKVLVGFPAPMTGKEAAVKAIYDNKRYPVQKTHPWKQALFEMKKDSVHMLDMKDDCYVYQDGMGLPKEVVEKALIGAEWVVYYSSRVIPFQLKREGGL